MRLPDLPERKRKKNSAGIIASENPEPNPLPSPTKGKGTRTRTRTRTRARKDKPITAVPGDKAVESMKKNRSVQHDSDYLQLQIGDHLSKNKRRGRSRSK